MRWIWLAASVFSGENRGTKKLGNSPKVRSVRARTQRPEFGPSICYPQLLQGVTAGWPSVALDCDTGFFMESEQRGSLECPREGDLDLTLWMTGWVSQQWWSLDVHWIREQTTQVCYPTSCKTQKLECHFRLSLTLMTCQSLSFISSTS